MQVTNSDSEQNAPSASAFCLPWVMIAAVEVCFAAQFLYTQGSLLILALAVAVPLTRFVPFRMPHTSWAPWILRLVAYGFIGAGMPKTDNSVVWLWDSDVMRSFGQVWAIEIAIQVWRQRPWGNPPG